MKCFYIHQIIVILLSILVMISCSYAYTTFTTRGFSYVNPKYQQQGQEQEYEQEKLEQYTQYYEHQRPQSTLPCQGKLQYSEKKKMKPEVLVEWKQLLFDFPSQQEYDKVLQDGTFIPTASIPIDVQPYYTDNGTVRIFVSTPRFAHGVPFTLSEVIKENGENKLRAYPNYDWHNTGNMYNCEKITGVFRVAITECQQMWVLDSGLAAEVFKCPPQLLLFDLRTDQLLHRFQFDTSVFTPTASYFVTPLAIVNDPPPKGKCEDTMLYIADTNYHGLVMYNSIEKKAWRAENKYMYPNPQYGTYTIAGQSFTLMDGIMGLAADRNNLYFHALAGVNELKVPLNILNNASIFENSVEGAQSAFEIVYTRLSPCIASAIDANGFLYCVTLNPIELIAWHPRTRETRKLAINKEHLQFVSGVKIIKNPQGIEELWLLSNRYQKLATGTSNFNEVNFRILKRPLDGR